MIRLFCTETTRGAGWRIVTFRSLEIGAGILREQGLRLIQRFRASEESFRGIKAGYRLRIFSDNPTSLPEKYLTSSQQTQTCTLSALLSSLLSLSSLRARLWYAFSYSYDIDGGLMKNIMTLLQVSRTGDPTCNTGNLQCCNATTTVSRFDASISPFDIYKYYWLDIGLQ